MSKKSAMVLGYTRSGHPVIRPSRRSFTADGFVGWERGDHVDAARILREHGEREQDPEIAPWCLRWAKAHREIGRSAKKHARVRGAAEIVIRMKGPR